MLRSASMLRLRGSGTIEVSERKSGTSCSGIRGSSDETLSVRCEGLQPDGNKLIRLWPVDVSRWVNRNGRDIHA
jgi:hypothetical protein